MIENPDRDDDKKSKEQPSEIEKHSYMPPDDPIYPMSPDERTGNKEEKK